MNRAIGVATIALFLLAAGLLLLPFESHRVVHSPGLDRNRPAGQITTGFALVETVPASFMAGLDPAAGADCIALRFATYMRRNQGRIEVSFGQQAHGHRWVLDASRLADNAYVNLCLDRPIDTTQPFWIGIQGLDGERDRSATVWLSAARGREVTINGAVRSDWGLALRLSQSRTVRLPDLVRLDHGVFLTGFLLSVAIGLLLLGECFARSGTLPRIAGGPRPPPGPASAPATPRPPLPTPTTPSP